MTKPREVAIALWGSLFWLTLLSAAGMASRAAAADKDAANGAIEVRHRLIELARRDGAEAIPVLSEALEAPHEIVRYTAVHLLVYLGDDARDALAANLNHDDVQVRLILIKALERLDVVDQYIEAIVRDESAVVRRYFYLHVMPGYLLADGKPSDALVAVLDAVYADASDEIRGEIIAALAGLPLTEKSVALLRRAADFDKAVAATEDADEKALVALRALLELDIDRMRELAETKAWRQLVEEFEDEDIAAWPDTDGRGRMVPGGWYANEAVEARYWLGRAWYELREGDKAENELRRALVRGPSLAHHRERSFYSGVLGLLGRNYQRNLGHRDSVGETYVEMLVEHAGDLAAHHRPEEALATYRQALKVEGLTGAQKKAIEKTIGEMD